ncbi:MAG: 3-hydroxyacyl-CoA dehydrogenase family protein [Candidatus Kariarchaeaceae archaeon]
MEISNVVVIGAGAMGSGIAYVVASSGYKVTIVDQTQEFLDKGMKGIRQKLKEGIERNKMTPAEAQKISQNIKTSVDLASAAADADLVIEAVFENMDVKKSIFTQLSQTAPDRCILASNTSTLSISEIATVVNSPARVVGLHFFNPPEAMKLVEVIIGEKSSEETVKVASAFAEQLGKTAIAARDNPGFIVNRLLVPMLNEAVKLLDEGVAGIEAIDQAAVLGAGFPAGPFVLADMVGLDVALASMRTLEDKLGSGYQPSPTLVRLVEEGKLGMKSGEGFHKYS